MLVLYPPADPRASSQSSFAVLAVDFLLRLLGTVVFGKIGDQLGRKTASIVADVGKHPRQA